MRHTRIALLLACALSTPWIAQGQERPLTTQQERMKSCNAQASGKGMKGEERRSFMSGCLKGDGDRQLTAQQQKMVTCNRTASDRQLKGDDRRAFMKDCLSAKRENSPSSAAGR